MTYTFSSYQKLHRGSKAPSFHLPGTDGKDHSLQEFSKSKGLLVVFMCNHCPYVKPKIGKLVELDQQYRSKGLMVVGICANDSKEFPEDDLDHMKRFAKEKGIRFHSLFDESQEVPKSYGATCTPDLFLFDENMALAYHGRIDDAHGKPHSAAKTNELEEAIRQLLDGKEVSVQSVPSAGCNIKWKR